MIEFSNSNLTIFLQGIEDYLDASSELYESTHEENCGMWRKMLGNRFPLRYDRFLS